MLNELLADLPTGCRVIVGLLVLGFIGLGTHAFWLNRRLIGMLGRCQCSYRAPCRPAMIDEPGG